MNKPLVYLIAGVLLSPIISNAQTIAERRAMFEQSEKDKASFQIFLSPNGQAIGVNPHTKQQTLVKNYIGVFKNKGITKKITVQYMPETDLVASYFVEQDDYGNMFYIENFLSEHGTRFTKEIIGQRVLEIIKSSNE